MLHVLALCPAAEAGAAPIPAGTQHIQALGPGFLQPLQRFVTPGVKISNTKLASPSSS